MTTAPQRRCPPGFRIVRSTVHRDLELLDGEGLVTTDADTADGRARLIDAACWLRDRHRAAEAARR